ncbi:MAG: heavy metal-associated domain-containing protein [Coriobacteriales bacterium]|jgi:copper chaperone CopZ
MKRNIKLGGEICANCASKIESQIAKLDGVNDVRVNAMTLKFTLDADDDKFDDALAQSIKIFGRVEPDCEVLA